MEAFRGVSVAEAQVILKLGHLLPTSPHGLMPFDNAVLETVLGEDFSEMSQGDIDYFITSVCPWYDGSLTSIVGGVNLTSDEYTAKDYANTEGVIFSVRCDGPVADFGEDYLFAKDATQCIPITGIYKGKSYVLPALSAILDAGK